MTQKYYLLPISKTHPRRSVLHPFSFKHLMAFGNVLVFETGVLRRIFESKREEVSGGWRTVNKEELRCLYCTRNIFTVM